MIFEKSLGKSKSRAAQFRLISLTCHIGKILEGIVSLRDKEQFAGKDYSLGMLVEKFLDIQEATQRETLLGILPYAIQLGLIFLYF